MTVRSGLAKFYWLWFNSIYSTLKSRYKLIMTLLVVACNCCDSSVEMTEKKELRYSCTRSILFQEQWMPKHFSHLNRPVPISAVHKGMEGTAEFLSVKLWCSSPSWLVFFFPSNDCTWKMIKCHNSVLDILFCDKSSVIKVKTWTSVLQRLAVWDPVVNIISAVVRPCIPVFQWCANTTALKCSLLTDKSHMLISLYSLSVFCLWFLTPNLLVCVSCKKFFSLDFSLEMPCSWRTPSDCYVPWKTLSPANTKHDLA